MVKKTAHFGKIFNNLDEKNGLDILFIVFLVFEKKIIAQITKLIYLFIYCFY